MFIITNPEQKVRKPTHLKMQELFLLRNQTLITPLTFSLLPLNLQLTNKP